jgi:hypothetical protein
MFADHLTQENFEVEKALDSFDLVPKPLMTLGDEYTLEGTHGSLYSLVRSSKTTTWLPGRFDRACCRFSICPHRIFAIRLRSYGKLNQSQCLQPGLHLSESIRLPLIGGATF